ncbi:hypothetical protein KAR91_10780 [Candidatus Pacearchaeota archaeon]|nr:hypothetical protein [Candidatus Pacearchaeota archaeon]
MDTNHAIPLLSQVLRRERNVEPGLHYLTIVDKQLELVRPNKLTPKTAVICTFTSFQVNEGMTAQQWAEAANKIAPLIEKGFLCPSP